MQQQQQPVVVVAGGHTISADSEVVANYKRCESTGSGVILLIVGLLSMIFMTVDIVLYKNYYFDSIAFVCHGLWVGAFFVIAGSLGIAAGKKSTRCNITAFMVFSIIAACLAPVQFSLGIYGALLTYDDCDYGDNCDDDDGAHYTSVAMESMLAIAAALGFAACLFGSIICCQGVCCNPSFQSSVTPTYVVHYGAPVVVAGQQQQAGPSMQAAYIVPAAASGSSYAYPMQPSQQFCPAPGYSHPEHPVIDPPAYYTEEQHRPKPQSYL